MLTAYYVLGKQITDIHFDSSETSFSVFFRGAQLDAYTDEVAHLEVYSRMIWRRRILSLQMTCV